MPDQAEAATVNEVSVTSTTASTVSLSQAAQNATSNVTGVAATAEPQTGNASTVPSCPVQTPTASSGQGTPASTPTPTSTPTTPVANTPTPLQQHQLQQLEHLQQPTVPTVGQPQLATQHQVLQQQSMIGQQQQSQMSQMQMQQLQQLQQVGQQQIGQGQQQIGHTQQVPQVQQMNQQQLASQQMQMSSHTQIQQPIMQQQPVQQMHQQSQQIQSSAVQQQLQQPTLQQQVVQPQQAQQNMQQMTQNNQSLSIVQTSTTVPGTIQAGTLRTPIGQVQLIPAVNNAVIQQAYSNIQQQLFISALQQQVNNNTAQQTRQQGVNGAQQRNGTQSPAVTTQTSTNRTSVVQSGQTNQASKVTTGNKVNSLQQPQQQQVPVMGGKPIVPRQNLVLGRLGVLSNPGNMSGQTTIAGTSGSHVLSSPTQIRLNNQTALVANTGQILNTQQPIMLSQLSQIPTMASLQQGIPMSGQMLNVSQAATFLGPQQVFIRTSGPAMQGQQGILPVQAVTSAQQGKQTQGNVKLVKLPSGLTARAFNPGQPGRRIRPKGTPPEQTTVKAHTMLVAPKGKKAGTTVKVATSTTTVTTEQSTKTTSVITQSVQSEPSTPVPKVDTTKPTPEPEERTSSPKTVPPQASVQPIVNIQPTANGNATIDSSGTNGTITVTDLGVVAKTEPMDVDREEEEEETPVEMADPTDEISKEKLKAVVKPHILTHVIDNFIIQEANEPFPVPKFSLMTDFFSHGVNLSDKSDTESTGADGTKRDKAIPPDAPKIKCEFCGKVDFAQKFRRSKRFCSISCAKRYNVGCSKRLRLFHSQNGIAHTPGGSKYVKKRKTPETKKKWKRQEGRVTTGPIQRTPSQCSEPGAWSSTTSEAASEITTEDDARSTTPDDTTTPNDSSPPRSPPVLEREGSYLAASSGPQQQKSSMTPQHQRRNQQQQGGDEVSPGSGGLIVIQPSPGLGDSQSSSTSTSSLSAASPRPASSTSPACHRRHPSTWSVLDVYEFISSLPGCSPYADEFRSQEIDGQALMLLKEDHLMSAMNMKLGPALKICAKITSLKEEHS